QMTAADTTWVKVCRSDVWRRALVSVVVGGLAIAKRGQDVWTWRRLRPCWAHYRGHSCAVPVRSVGTNLAVFEATSRTPLRDAGCIAKEQSAFRSERYAGFDTVFHTVALVRCFVRVLEGWSLPPP